MGSPATNPSSGSEHPAEGRKEPRGIGTPHVQTGEETAAQRQQRACPRRHSKWSPGARPASGPQKHLVSLIKRQQEPRAANAAVDSACCEFPGSVVTSRPPGWPLRPHGWRGQKRTVKASGGAPGGDPGADPSPAPPLLLGAAGHRGSLGPRGLPASARLPEGSPTPACPAPRRTLGSPARSHLGGRRRPPRRPYMPTRRRGQLWAPGPGASYRVTAQGLWGKSWEAPEAVEWGPGDRRGVPQGGRSAGLAAFLWAAGLAQLAARRTWQAEPSLALRLARTLQGSRGHLQAQASPASDTSCPLSPQPPAFLRPPWAPGPAPHLSPVEVDWWTRSRDQLGPVRAAPGCVRCVTCPGHRLLPSPDPPHPRVSRPASVPGQNPGAASVWTAHGPGRPLLSAQS